MIDAVHKLSEGIPFVRVDMYEVYGKPYFGEMTMTPMGGFIDCYTKKLLRELGKDISLKRKE